MSQSVSIKKTHRGIYRAFDSTISCILWGMAIGMAINTYLWVFHGYDVLMRELSITYQGQIAQIKARDSRAFEIFNSLVLKSSRYLTQGEALLHSHLANMDKHTQADDQNSAQLKSYLVQGETFTRQLLNVICTTLLVLIAKLLSVLISIWVFVFAGSIGLIDGFLTRYIRTAEAGRESTFVYHRIAEIVLKVPLGILTLYLISPLFVDARIVVLVMSVLFFAFFYLMASNLKKFL